MKPNDELLSLIPEAVRDIAYCSFHRQSQTWYVYRRDGYSYDKTKRRGVDLRTPIGRIKDGEWKYSPSWLRLTKAERRTAARAEGSEGAAARAKGSEDAAACAEDSKGTAARAEGSEGSAARAETAKFLHSPSERVASKESMRALQALHKYATAVPDTRTQKKVNFPLPIVLKVMALAMLGGYTSAKSIESYWKRWFYELKLMFGDELPDELISHDTINRLMRIIKPEDIKAMMRYFTSELVAQKSDRVIHVDGKAIRASKSEKCQGGRYALNIYESTHGVLITHDIVDEKENEITALKPILSQFDLKPGDVLTADAMHTQRSLVVFLNSLGVDWCLPVKDNHPTFAKELLAHFNLTDDSRKKTYTPEIPEGTEHGRIEMRSFESLPGSMLSASFKKEWPGLENGTIIKVVTNCEFTSGKIKPRTPVERYYITSLPFKPNDSARKQAKLIRDHWSIENGLHWVLDVVFDEDRVHATDATYLYTRSLFLKAGLNILKAVQRHIWETEKRRVSINQLKEMCSSPLEALEMHDILCRHTEIQGEVKS